MITKAAVLEECNAPLVIENLEIPSLVKGQVLVKIHYSGVCHSQINEVRGLKGQDRFLPHTLGHEGSGVVVRVGPGVKKVKENDRVVMTWIKGQGADIPCTKYRCHKDGEIVNSGAISTFMTQAVVSENRLVPISDDMPLREAALLGCAVPTGAGMIFNTAKLNSHSSIAIVGTGGIGLSAIMAAYFMNASVIIGIDVSDNKLSMAKQFGATHTVNALCHDPLNAILEITDGKGVDFSVEAAGQKKTMETAFKAVRKNGGMCIISGNLPHGEKISLDPFDLINGKRIVGTWGGETVPDRDIPLYVGLYLSGKLNLGDLITKTYDLASINQALEAVENGPGGRILIEMQ